MFHPYWRYACAGPMARASRDRCSPSERRTRHTMHTWAAGPMFGVRRPLRHLTWKLDLTEGQIRELAGVLDRLKTAYAQRDSIVNDPSAT